MESRPLLAFISTINFHCKMERHRRLWQTVSIVYNQPANKVGLYLLCPDALTYHLGSLANTCVSKLAFSLGTFFLPDTTVWGKWVFCMEGFCSSLPRQVSLFCPFLFLGISVVHFCSLWSLGKLIKISQLSLSECLEPKRVTLNFQWKKICWTSSHAEC